MIRWTMIIALIVSSLAFPVRAEWIEGGNPICTQEYSQSPPEIVSDGQNGAIIIWKTSQLDKDTAGYAQRIDSGGNVLWAHDGALIYSKQYCKWYGHESIPDGEGGAIVAFCRLFDLPPPAPDYYDIVAIKFDGNGAPVWPDTGVAICMAPEGQSNPVIVSDGEGGGIIFWRDGRDPTNSNIYAQRIDRTGNALWQHDGVPICLALNNQWNIKAAPDGAGGAFATWMDSRNTDRIIYVQYIDANGVVRFGTNGTAITPPSSFYRIPRIVSDGEGGAIVLWSELFTDAHHILAQRIDRDGYFLWPTDDILISDSPGPKSFINVAADGSGGIFVSWDDICSGDPDNPHIFSQHIDADGSALWTPGGIPVMTVASRKHRSAIVPDGSGGVYIGWEDERSGDHNLKDLYAQWIAADGSVQWGNGGMPLCTADQGQYYPVGIPDGEGGAFFAWKDMRNADTYSANADVYATRITGRQAVNIVVDVRPGSCPNPLNPKSLGLLPVAVLGCEELDVAMINPSSIRLEGVAPLRFHIADIAAPSGENNSCTGSIKSPDGYADLMIKFNTRDIVAALGGLDGIAGAKVTLEAVLEDDTHLMGQDQVIIVGNGPRKDPESGRHNLYVRSGPGEMIQTVQFEIPERANVEISVYDVSGRHVARIGRTSMPAGDHLLDFDTSGYCSGVYFLRLRAGSYVAVKKFVLIR